MKLIHNAKLLTEEESGGHGDKWQVFMENTEIEISSMIPNILEKSFLTSESKYDNNIEGSLLHFYDNSEECRVISLIGRDSEGANQFVSMYPEFKGKRFAVTIEKIELFPNTYEARLDIAFLSFPWQINIFDTRFLDNKYVYEENKAYIATISALAYSMHLLEGEPIIIDEVEAAERHHATRYWVEKYGVYKAEQLDEALALYRKEAEISTEPIVIDTNQMCMWMNDDVHTDDLRYSGVIKDFAIDSFALLGVTFHCYYVGIRFQGEELVLPFYVKEDNFTDDWLPAVGDYVEGYAWIHGSLDDEN